MVRFAASKIVPMVSTMDFGIWDYMIEFPCFIKNQRSLTKKTGERYATACTPPVYHSVTMSVRVPGKKTLKDGYPLDLTMSVQSRQPFSPLIRTLGMDSHRDVSKSET